MKQNKITLAVCPDDKLRAEMLRKIAVQMGFARTPADAAKIIRPTVHDFDLSTAYFVFAESYHLGASPVTTQRLFELAARGLAVVVGTRRLPPAFEPFCTAVYPEGV